MRRIVFLGSALASILLLIGSCAKQETSLPEQPPARGQRDRVMSELHGTRKLMLDALERIGDTQLTSPVAEGQPSPSEAVEALIVRERRLLTAMSSAELPAAAHPLENESLTGDERRRVDEEAQNEMRGAIASCAEKMGPAEFQMIPNPSNLGKADLIQGFKVARDDTIAFARETNYSLLRRKISDEKCGEMNLRTAMMLQAALTEKMVEYVNQAAKGAGN